MCNIEEYVNNVFGAIAWQGSEENAIKAREESEERLTEEAQLARFVFETGREKEGVSCLDGFSARVGRGL